MLIPPQNANDHVQIVCGLCQFRSWHDEQPFLRSLRHTSCVATDAQVEFRLTAINHGGMANVERVSRMLLDKQVQNDMAALAEASLWYGAACVEFLDGTLSVAALLQLCLEY